MKSYATYYPKFNIEIILEYYNKNKVKKKVINKLYTRLITYFMEMN